MFVAAAGTVTGSRSKRRTQPPVEFESIIIIIIAIQLIIMPVSQSVSQSVIHTPRDTSTAKVSQARQVKEIPLGYPTSLETLSCSHHASPISSRSWVCCCYGCCYCYWCGADDGLLVSFPFHCLFTLLPYLRTLPYCCRLGCPYN